MPWRIAFRQGGRGRRADAGRRAGRRSRPTGATVTSPGRARGRSPIASTATASCWARPAARASSITCGTQGTYRYEVAAVGWQGEIAARAGRRVRREPLPRGTAKDAWLDELTPLSQRAGLRLAAAQPQRRRQAAADRRQGATPAAWAPTPTARSATRSKNRYQRFEAEVGVDDEKDGGGTVVFQVFADGRKVFDSGVMRGKQPAKKVSVPLDGVEELLLVVTDAGDGINCDHADWADARLIGNP